MIVKKQKLIERRSVPFKFLEDENLTLRSKGILATLFTMYERQVITVSYLMQFHTEKRYAIKQSLKELEEKGYLISQVVPIGGNKTRYRFIIVDEPSKLNTLDVQRVFDSDAEKSVFKHRDWKPFVQISKTAFFEHEMSFKALGLLLVLFSMSDDFVFNPKNKSRMKVDGVEAIESGLVELKHLGYVKREQARQVGGEFGEPITIIYDVPVQPDEVNLDAKKPMAEKLQQNKDKNKDKNYNNILSLQKSRSGSNSFTNFPQRGYDNNELKKYLLNTDI